RLQKLVEKMERVSVERAEKDINTAKLLEKAAQIAREADEMRAMQDTSDQLLYPKKDGGPQLNRAIKNQAESCKTLELMIEALEEQNNPLLEALIKNQKQEQGNLKE